MRNKSKVLLKHRQQIRDLMSEGIRCGVVKPLNRTVFSIDKCEEAFRYMSSGKHTGKVVIKIRDEEINDSSDVTPIQVMAIPRTVFNPNMIYIITGGLGGMGLELIEWMIERGAKIFLVNSRFGPKTSYQKYKIQYLEKSGTKIHISYENLHELSGTQNLFKIGESFAKIGGIFHLQLILIDGLFENQTPENFNRICSVKSKSLENMDLISRKLYPNIEYFIAFSSVVSSRGNAGQSNYGYTNAVMDRICELRRSDGLNGLSIHWGPIGDVGYVAENIGNEFQLSGTIQQRITSCLTVLDRILQSNLTICSSFVNCDTNIINNHKFKYDLMKRVAYILGNIERSSFIISNKFSLHCKLYFYIRCG